MNVHGNGEKINERSKKKKSNNIPGEYVTLLDSQVLYMLWCTTAAALQYSCCCRCLLVPWLQQSQLGEYNKRTNETQKEREKNKKKRIWSYVRIYIYLTCAKTWFIAGIATVIDFITVFVQWHASGVGACKFGHGTVGSWAKLTRFVVSISVDAVDAGRIGTGWRYWHSYRANDLHQYGRCNNEIGGWPRWFRWCCKIQMQNISYESR